MVVVACVSLVSSPTSPRTAQSGRLPSGPGAGPLGATAASDAGGGGLGDRGTGTRPLPPIIADGAIVSKPPTKSILLPPLLVLDLGAVEESSASTEALFCCCGFTLRMRIFLRGAGCLPVEPSLGSGGGDAPTSIATMAGCTRALSLSPSLARAWWCGGWEWHSSFLPFQSSRDLSNR